MSNRSFASQYNGAPNVGHSSGGGSDLFGLQAKRQKDIMMLQQAQELEKMRNQELLNEKQNTQEGDIANKKSSFDASVALLKAQGIIPNDTNIKSYDDATTQQRLAIAKTENDIEQAQKGNQLSTLQSKPGQDAMTGANLAVLAKLAIDNNEAKARAQALSTTVVPPNTGVRVGAPGGDFATKPQDFFGGTQQTQVVGGIKNPATGEMIGGHPVETYGRPQFPSVGKIDLGDSQNLTNNIQAKPTPLDNSVAGPLGTSFATQPPIITNPLMTKPPVDNTPAQPVQPNGAALPGMVDPNSLLARFLMKKLQPAPYNPYLTH